MRAAGPVEEAVTSGEREAARGTAPATLEGRNENHYHWQIADGLRQPAPVKAPSRLTLDTLRRGQKAVITAVDPADPAVQRLMVLGLVAGAEVEATGAAIGGDPLEFRLFGNGISLRREQARHFVIVAADGG